MPCPAFSRPSQRGRILVLWLLLGAAGMALLGAGAAWWGNPRPPAAAPATPVLPARSIGPANTSPIAINSGISPARDAVPSAAQPPPPPAAPSAPSPATVPHTAAMAPAARAPPTRAASSGEQPPALPLSASRTGTTVATEMPCAVCGSVEAVVPRAQHDAGADVAALGTEIAGARAGQALVRPGDAGAQARARGAAPRAATPDGPTTGEILAAEFGARTGRDASPPPLPFGYPAAFVASVRMDDGTLVQIGLAAALPLGQRVRLEGGAVRAVDAIPHGPATGKIYRTD